jgi:hypothetical protein
LIVAKLNLTWDKDQISKATADEWYEELAGRPADRVWRAVRRVRRQQKFRPELAELLAACAEEARAEVSDQPALTARVEGPGAPMPANVRAQLAAMGLRRVGRRVPADDRANQARLEAERRRQLAELAAMSGKKSAG